MLPAGSQHALRSSGGMAQIHASSAVDEHNSPNHAGHAGVSPFSAQSNDGEAAYAAQWLTRSHESVELSRESLPPDILRFRMNERQRARDIRSPEHEQSALLPRYSVGGRREHLCP